MWPCRRLPELINLIGLRRHQHERETFECKIRESEHRPEDLTTQRARGRKRNRGRQNEGKSELATSQTTWQGRRTQLRPMRTPTSSWT